NLFFSSLFVVFLQELLWWLLWVQSSSTRSRKKNLRNISKLKSPFIRVNIKAPIDKDDHASRSEFSDCGIMDEPVSERISVGTLQEICKTLIYNLYCIQSETIVNFFSFLESILPKPKYSKLSIKINQVKKNYIIDGIC
ncbi:hypothetical protein ACJX0J_025369, partial [Zea mays]